MAEGVRGRLTTVEEKTLRFLGLMREQVRGKNSREVTLRTGGTRVGDGSWIEETLRVRGPVKRSSAGWAPGTAPEAHADRLPEVPDY